MISLAHAFNTAGCKNIIHSLWFVDENSSIAVGQEFLNLYGENNDAAAALRAAKLDYIKSAQPELKAPCYWGGLVLKAQLKPSNKWRWKVWLTGLLGLIALGWLARKFV